jgi:hypothetical protein
MYIAFLVKEYVVGKKPAMPSTTEVYGICISQPEKYKSCSLHKQKDSFQNYKCAWFQFGLEIYHPLLRK